MIIASIDIGTNTVLLLLAEADKSSSELKTITNLYNMPRIGKGLQKGGTISPDKIELLVNILKEYKETSLKYKAERIILTATNAFRIAANACEIVSRVKNELGLEIEIIPGVEEAKYSYLGAAQAAKAGFKKLVIDIGGGSTEIIIGIKDEIIFKKSFQIGVVSLTERFVTQNPPTGENIIAITNFIKETFSELKDFSTDKLSAVAVAGTPTTLSCIKQNIKYYDAAKVEGSILTKNDLGNLVKEISPQTSEEIKQNYGGVVAGREDVLLAGTLILFQLCEILNLDEIIVSSKGLRYGAVINYLRVSQ